MKNLLLSLAAAAALGLAAAPAAAHSWGHDRYDHQHHGGAYGDRLATPYVDGLEWKIRNAARNGWISWGEAHHLLAELRSVQPLAWRYQTGQAARWELRRLASVVDHIDSRTSRHAYNTHWRGW